VPREQFTTVQGSVKPPIALMVGRFIPAAGGLESWAHDLAVALVARGYPVRVLTTEADLNSTGHPAGVGIDLVAASGRPIEQAHIFAAAARRLGDHIVHDTGIGLGADILQPQMGCRVLNIAREDAQHSLGRRLRLAVSPRHQRYVRVMARLERAQLAAARCVVAVSRESQAAFRDRYGVPEARIRVIPNGIDTTRFYPGRAAHTRARTREALGIGPRTLVLLAAAGNFRLKGVHHTIGALAAVRRKFDAMCLLVAGEGAIEEFRTLAQLAGVADRVRFLGRVDDMPALFGAADVFVHPTAHDACSLATLEAMASGLPVVTTRRNGAADGMTEGCEGFVLEAPDSEALANRLLRLRDPSVRAAMGVRARLLAERHDFAATVDRLEQVYAELPGRAAGAAA
jgi:UDP-glucose:(heptosyl)LPS alpha-1,3-glucosyltransferase